MLMRPLASFELARQLQIGAASVGDVFAFCSGLYFRGKLTYARRFAEPERIHVITPSRGLVAPDLTLGIDDMVQFSSVEVASTEPRFTLPLQASAELIARAGDADVVLLGSIATGKYVETLLPILGERLLFPADFVGRGDMSRGAQLLRHAREGVELPYIPVAGAVRRGMRAPRVSATTLPRG